MRFFFILIILGCQQQKGVESAQTETPRLNYATTFRIEENGGHKKIITTEPWPKASRVKEFNLKKSLQRVVCTSTSHIPYFELLGAEDAVVGFPEVKYISSQKFLDRVDNGSIVDLGNGQNINLELLIKLAPDAVIAFDAGGSSNMIEKIEKLGIPVIYNSDFLEQTPLGRAEYIKFFGALLGKEKQADSIFMKIEDDYQLLKKTTSKTDDRPSILSGIAYGGTWFLPGGENWFAQFFHDAGGNYLWGDTPSSGWLELSVEAVYEKAYNADFWIGTSSLESLSDLKSQDDRYAQYKAFRENKVYNYNKKKSLGEGIDFFESGYSRPDLVLADLIKVLHPELLPAYETIYFQKLE